MFSGIIEGTAQVVRLEKEGTNLHLTLTTPIAGELKIDQSMAHNGVCLTVVDIQGDTYTVTAIDETLKRSNLGDLHVGDKVNIERAMPMGGRLDGHIVQGHVDTTAECIAVEPADGSHVFTFRYAVAPELIRRGYFTVDKDTFSVCIIPYTLTHTNFCDIHVGTKVNLEFDILGKYIARLQELTEK